MAKQSDKVKLESKCDTKLVISQVTRWLEQAVIGLDLCPFAKPVWQQCKIRYVVSSGETCESLLSDLAEEFIRLSTHPSIETTLIVIPNHLNRFDDFNQFLGIADDLLEHCDWAGIYQLASFHPDYQFAGTSYDDRENWTNRSPFPILHLLRESSLSRVIDSYPNVIDIPSTNIERLISLDNAIFREIFFKK